MKFIYNHNNINVFDLEKSVNFYEQALKLSEVRRKQAPDGSFTLIFMSDGESGHSIELTWLRDRDKPYNLGDNEIHMCFKVDDYEAAHKLHSEMGCICYENEKMGLYFINDPDGYWTEIIPLKR
jgi:lactoylglutathione lyase